MLSLENKKYLGIVLSGGALPPSELDTILQNSGWSSADIAEARVMMADTSFLKEAQSGMYFEAAPLGESAADTSFATVEAAPAADIQFMAAPSTEEFAPRETTSEETTSTEANAQVFDISGNIPDTALAPKAAVEQVVAPALDTPVPPTAPVSIPTGDTSAAAPADTPAAVGGPRVFASLPLSSIDTTGALEKPFATETLAQSTGMQETAASFVMPIVTGEETKKPSFLFSFFVFIIISLLIFLVIVSGAFYGVMMYKGTNIVDTIAFIKTLV